MSEVSSSGAALRGTAPGLVGRPVAIDRTGTKPAADRQTGRAAERPSDRVELSERAKYLAKLRVDPPVRRELIDHVKAQIEAGEYDTPEKFDAALDGLAEDVDLMS